MGSRDPPAPTVNPPLPPPYAELPSLDLAGPPPSFPPRVELPLSSPPHCATPLPPRPPSPPHPHAESPPPSPPPRVKLPPPSWATVVIPSSHGAVHIQAPSPSPPPSPFPSRRHLALSTPPSLRLLLTDGRDLRLVTPARHCRLVDAHSTPPTLSLDGNSFERDLVCASAA